LIERWSEGTADDHMGESILVDLAPVVARHPWWRARAALTLALLGRLGLGPPARVLDAGCGWGVTLEALERSGFEAVGLDVSRRALERLDAPGRRLVEADLARPLPAEAGPFDAVLALDVIEHLDDDGAVIGRLGSLLKPGGVLVVSVPALPELYSEFDAVQGHRRRYTPGRLRAAFHGAPLAVERLFWWGGWMVPILARQRRRPGRSTVPDASASAAYRRYLRLPPWPGPWALRAAYAMEQGRALAGRLRRGTSLFAVARPAVPPIAVSSPGPPPLYDRPRGRRLGPASKTGGV
jgi:SAM-dependent methyltransferase